VDKARVAAPESEAAPFRIEVPESEIEDLRRRLLATRWPDQIPDSAWEYGADRGTIRQLADYWANEYDWRTHEGRLNSFPQFTTVIDGQRIHYMHVRSPYENALPLLMTHGWPGSISEFVHVIEPLVDPPSVGRDPGDAFHLVIPSLPGYGFSGPTTERGWDVRRTAAAWARLMAGLGYDQYAIQGGDWGSMLCRHLADLDSGHVLGMHLNCFVSLAPGAPDDRDDLTPHEQRQLARADEYMASGNAYAFINGTRPQSLAYGLVDSPVGLLAWITEKFWAWTDHDGNFEDAVSRDDLLTNVSIYWFTATAGSAARMYYESMATMSVLPPATTKVPLGIASFPGEVVMGRRRWIEEGHDLVHWQDYDRGGHFAALEVPDVLVGDICDFFRPRR
jgi:microsomal epoxide hydrolase